MRIQEPAAGAPKSSGILWDTTLSFTNMITVMGCHWHQTKTQLTSYQLQYDWNTKLNFQNMISPELCLALYFEDQMCDGTNGK